MSKILSTLEHIDSSLGSLAESLDRIAKHLAPEPGDIVGTPYVAKKLGLCTAAINKQARKGQIPRNCIFQGGNGTPWKFHRAKIDAWIDSGRLLVHRVS